jgi:hypothetical protein
MADETVSETEAAAPPFQPIKGVTMIATYMVQLRCVFCGVFRNEQTQMSNPRHAQREAIRSQGMVVAAKGVACPRCAQVDAEG